MRSLPESFKSDGFTFRLLERRERVALLLKSKGRIEGYEVVKLRIRKARQVVGRWIPASETIPPSQAWGLEGWSYTDLAAARAKFEELATARQWPAVLTHPPQFHDLVAAPATNPSAEAENRAAA